MIDAAVIILNWNGERLLPACLSALASQTYRDYELWLVDNGSIDGSHALLDDLESTRQPDWLAAPLPRPARLIRNTRNVGFATGNNQAIKRARARYIVALNNDAIPEPQWLAELVFAAEQGGPSTGMVASTMLFSHKPNIAASAGISIHRDGVALDRALGLPGAQLERGGIRPVFGPSAGAALYRAALLRDVGLFDDRFFSYLEDADLAWRARSRGWRAVHNPRARVTHEYSSTGGHNSPMKRRLISRNRVWLMYKNMPEPLLQRNWSSILRYDSIAVIGSLLSGDRHLIRGRVEALSLLRDFTADRREIITSSRLHPDEIERLLSPALSLIQALKYRKRLNCLLQDRPL